MSDPRDEQLIAEDVRALQRMGYAQELRRGMSAFSNYALSLSIICILAGGITSFHIGFCSVGGAPPSASAGRSRASSRWRWRSPWGRSRRRSPRRAGSTTGRRSSAGGAGGG